MACCDKKLPGMVRMAGNAARAAGRVVVAVVRHKQVKVEPSVAAVRLAACLKCGQMTEATGKSGKVYHRCAACGCWLDGLGFSKTQLATETCPMGNWGED